MAKKISSKKSVAKKGSKSKSLVTMAAFEKQMVADAQEDSERLGKDMEGNRLAIKDGEFSFQGNDMGSELDVIIVNFASINEDYGHCKYDPDDLNSPRCAAVGLGDNDSLEPSTDSPDQQAEDCMNCEWNAWESAEVGKGKACRNKKKLALVHSDGVMDDEVEPAFLFVPPASLVNFRSYVKSLAKKTRRPVYSVTTRISFDEDDDKVLTFKALDKIDDPKVMSVIIEQRELVKEDLLADPDFSNYHIVTKKTRKVKEKSAGKKSARKKSKFSK